MFKNLLHDLVAKLLAFGGTAIGASGVATKDETTAVMGGVAALIGIVWNLYNNSRAHKEVSIVATAVDEKKTISEVAASPAAPKAVSEIAAKAPTNYNRSR